MPTPVVNPALGTILKHGAGGPLVYTAVGQVTSIDGIGGKMGTRPTDHLTSTAKTYAKTLFDGSEISVEMELDPKGDVHTTLIGLFFGNTQLTNGEPWQILFADATNGPSTATFAAIITNFEAAAGSNEDNLMASMSLKISGLVTWA